MDINRLSMGQRIAAGAGILLFIDLFLSWYSANTDVVSLSVSGWEIFSWVDLVCAAAAIVAVLAAVQAMGMVQIPANLNMILTPLAAVATILVLYRLINQPGNNSLINNEFGAYIGFLLAALMTYGSVTAGDSSAGTATLAPAAAAPAPPPPAAPPADPPAAPPAAAPPADPPAAPPSDPPAV